MIRRQGWIIEAPPVKVVFVPLRKVEILRNLHPMTLCFVIAIHWRCVVACLNAMSSCVGNGKGKESTFNLSKDSKQRPIAPEAGSRMKGA